MQCSEVIVNPFLQNLPFNIELNQWGKIEMSPASNKHGLLKAETAQELRHKRGGKVISECGMQISSGVRVAGLAWLSNAKFAKFGEKLRIRQPPLFASKSCPSSTAGRKCT